MFKLAQKFLLQQRVINDSNLIRRMISTTDEVKSVTIGELATDIVNDQKLKNTPRTFYKIKNHSMPIAARVTLSNDQSRDFMAIFPDVVLELTNIIRTYKCNDAATWFAKALQYNVPQGRKTRGLLTVFAYKNLVRPEDLTTENMRLSYYLGWCVELLQSYLIVVDDVMDHSPTRRGLKCWHQVENVGLTAINDALMLENALYLLLKQHFSHLDCYVPILELFHEISFITNCGQSLDALNSYKRVSDFTMEDYVTIAENKTAYYTFYLPFAIAMYLASYNDPEAFRQTKKIVPEIGRFFQVQNDFLDCFGDPKATGKIGTDIQDNKCSWLAVVAMQRANAEQKQIMIDCYGKSDPAKIAQVKELYNDLSLPSIYSAFEKESYNKIKSHIQQTSRGLPLITLLQIINKIYQLDE